MVLVGLASSAFSALSMNKLTGIGGAVMESTLDTRHSVYTHLGLAYPVPVDR
jgi:hypothetical protein